MTCPYGYEGMSICTSIDGGDGDDADGSGGSSAIAAGVGGAVGGAALLGVGALIAIRFYKSQGRRGSGGGVKAASNDRDDVVGDAAIVKPKHGPSEYHTLYELNETPESTNYTNTTYIDPDDSTYEDTPKIGKAVCQRRALPYMVSLPLPSDTLFNFLPRPHFSKCSCQSRATRK